MNDKIVNAIFSMRWAILIICSVLLFGAHMGKQYLGFETDYRVFFAEDNKELIAFEDLQKTFGKEDNVLIVIEPNDKTVFKKESLDLIKQITDKSWKIPYTKRVDSVTNFQHVTAVKDNLIIADLYSETSKLSIDKIKDIAIAEPLLVNRLISKSGHVSAVNIEVEMPGKSPYENSEIVAAVRDLAKTIEKDNPDHKVYLTGLVMYNNAFLESSLSDSATIIPAMYILFALVLALVVRRVAGVISIIGVVYLSVEAGLGMAGWLGINLSTLSAQSPIIILAIAGAASVHVVISYIQQYNKGMQKRDAMKESLRTNLMPVFLTSLTTAVGFLSLNFSDVPPINDLGNIVSLGVLATFILCIAVLPNVCVLIPLKESVQVQSRTGIMGNVSNYVINNKNYIVWIIPAVSMIFIAFTANNELNDEYVKYFDESQTFRTDTDFTTRNLTGLYSIHFSIEAEEGKEITDPKFLKSVELFSTWLREQPEVKHVNTITDTIKRINKNLHADDDNYYRLPNDGKQIAQYLLLYNMSLPFGLDMNNRKSLDNRFTRVSASLESLSTKGLLDIEQRADNWLKAHNPSLRYKASSTSIMFAHIGDKNVSSMLMGTFIALLLISLIIAAALRSVKLGVISLMTNLLPILVAYGIWGMLFGQIGLSLTIVACMTLGIVVDDTVHFLSKYWRSRKVDGYSEIESVKVTIQTVGSAILVSSTVLVIGFLSLSRSTFSLNADMGVATAIVILLAVVIDLLLLPAVLIKFKQKHAHGV